jgi:peroxygenase
MFVSLQEPDYGHHIWWGGGCRAAANLEWSLAYLLLKDKDGFLTKEAIRGVYDGSIFYEIERKRQQSKMEGSSA